MKDIIRHQLRFSVPTTKHGEVIDCKLSNQEVEREHHFFSMKSEIKIWEIPLNQVTFLRIFSSYLESIGVKCFLEDETQNANLQLFDLNLFCHFYFSVETTMKEQTLKSNLFDLIDIDPKTLIKKSDIIILPSDSLKESLQIFSNDKRETKKNAKTFLVFIRRIENEFEFKLIFKAFEKKYKKHISYLKLNYLMPRFSISKECIGIFRKSFLSDL